VVVENVDLVSAEPGAAAGGGGGGGGAAAPSGLRRSSREKNGTRRESAATAAPIDLVASQDLDASMARGDARGGGRPAVGPGPGGDEVVDLT